MVATIANALAAYKSAASPAVDLGMPAEDAAGASFSQMLQNAARSSVDTLKAGEQLSGQAAVGKADLTDVVNAVNNAETMLNTIVAVRDKVVSAYQDIIKMSI
ncbi:MAG: flagellar hook-basal body complex protein FliE [Azospirillaceae bacterium]|nr:flagellar hook-basal body complex protein FliE [Azospirillaceae bacterium]